MAISHGFESPDWTEKSGSGVALPTATRDGRTNQRHVIDSLIAKCDDANSRIYFKTGDVLLGELDIGNESLIRQVNLVGSKGQAISAEQTGTGTITITGHSKTIG